MPRGRHRERGGWRPSAGTQGLPGVCVWGGVLAGRPRASLCMPAGPEEDLQVHPGAEREDLRAAGAAAHRPAGAWHEGRILCSGAVGWGGHCWGEDEGEGGRQWAVGRWVCVWRVPGWSLAAPRSRSPSTRTGAAAAAPAAAAPAAAAVAGGAAQGAGDWQRVPAGTRTAGTAASPKSAGCTTRAPASEPRAGGQGGQGGPGGCPPPLCDVPPTAALPLLRPAAGRGCCWGVPGASH